MDQQLSQSNAVEEISFAELTALVRAELKANRDSTCNSISKRYGISETTLHKLIEQIKSAEGSMIDHP